MGSILTAGLILTEGILIGYSLAKSGVVEATYQILKDKVARKQKQELL